MEHYNLSKVIKNNFNKLDIKGYTIKVFNDIADLEWDSTESNEENYSCLMTQITNILIDDSFELWMCNNMRIYDQIIEILRYDLNYLVIEIFKSINADQSKIKLTHTQITELINQFETNNHNHEMDQDSSDYEDDD